MPNRDLVVIGASAGGTEPLQLLLNGLPADLDAAVLIVLHTSSIAAVCCRRFCNVAAKLPVSHPDR